ncbi:SDR family NAD(P)-dependent oxidoreductase [Streptomyces sp. 351MFTsu5.1]|uniref:SDR family NAD(P)-dependent oxidoreductase n=1 Tax=Streptomyces sp. 351MFTsu5.1 TaxID=1172180 RepID=UPI0003795CCB|nr:SDR family NAD(P)-dependent oxidoreductase [Streptomyces sp. 351MFTsu5.1]
MDIAGKTAVVAGGTSGLGLAAAEALAAKGARVAILGRRVDAGRRIADRLGGIAFEADTTDADAVGRAIAGTVERFGAVHINVNTAGIIEHVAVLPDGRPADLVTFRRIVEVNLMGTFNVMRLAIHAMAQNDPEDGERGVVINTASVSAFDGVAGHAAYSASKAALVGMTLPVARDLSGRGIRVNTIAPGAFDTPINDFLPPGYMEQVERRIPNPSRSGRPEEFAALACHLVENAYINAATIRQDGGLRFSMP